MLTTLQVGGIREGVDLEAVCSALGIRLLRRGGRLAACCPLHTEKTPSFYVSPAAGLWHCFGCGKGGDVFTLVQEIKKVDFPAAVRFCAELAGITIEEEELTAEEQERMRREKDVADCCTAAAIYYQQQLRKSPSALTYARSRWSEDDIEEWAMGYAPDGPTALSDLMAYLTGVANIPREIIEQSGLVALTDDGRRYAAFRDRLMLPLKNMHGAIVGFTGRALDPQVKAKYKNTAESETFRKSEILYGWEKARRAARERGEVVLVEGNPDVIRLHSIGVQQAVCAMGGGLSERQMEAIVAAAPVVTLLYDRDEAGRRFTERSAELLLQKGARVMVMQIPDDPEHPDQKADPDSYFTTPEVYRQVREEHRISYLEYYTQLHAEEATDPTSRSQLMHRVAAYLVNYPSDEQMGYVARLAALVPSRAAWSKALSEQRKRAERQQPLKTGEDGLTDDERAMSEKYGIYVRSNQTYIVTQQGRQMFANFALTPRFLMRSEGQVKRLFTITNAEGESYEMEIDQKTLTSPADFETAVAEMGNFWYNGSREGLSRLKRLLYEQTRTCREVTQMGWQTEGFWAWGNGITTAAGFQKPDQTGVVEVKGQYYYLPSTSRMAQEDRRLYAYEKRCAYESSEASLPLLADRMLRVYGENAMVALAYYWATLFRDILFERYGSFPLLNIFGQPGTGKTQMAVTLMQLFGRHDKGVNLTNSTRAALADALGAQRNALCHIDEYKNTVDYEKIEILKSIYDGTGRNRINRDRGFRKEQTLVDCGVVLTGQELTTADNALFKRVLFLQLDRTVFTDTATQEYNALKTYERRGLTQITAQMLAYRAAVEKDIAEASEAASSDLRRLTAGRGIESRILENWTQLLAVARVVMPRLGLPFTYDDLLNLTARRCIEQNQAVSTASEVNDFWAAMESLIASGELEHDYDVRLYRQMTGLRTVKGRGRDAQELDYQRPIDVLMVNPGRVFPLYFQMQKRVRDARRTQIDEGSLRRYLTAQDDYLGERMTKFKVATRMMQNVASMVTTTANGQRSSEPWKTARALCFDYGRLQAMYGIDLAVTVECAVNHITEQTVAPY